MTKKLPNTAFGERKKRKGGGSLQYLEEMRGKRRGKNNILAQVKGKFFHQGKTKPKKEGFWSRKVRKKGT